VFAVENNMIKSILRVDDRAHTYRNGLHNFYVAVEVSLFVEDVDHPVAKCAEKISFTELKDLDWSFWRGGGLPI
jgi:hypothetical protein